MTNDEGFAYYCETMPVKAAAEDRETCPWCAGTGQRLRDDEWVSCGACGGDGWRHKPWKPKQPQSVQ